MNAGTAGAATGNTMRAVLITQFGGPEVLRVVDAPIPAPARVRC
ncbi:hypothetical protein [Mycolicibacterium brumae]|nr:hypothetical protein [Mycolicibacterium brumae]RWA19283.1 hypothetical protein MBRU_17140 [Mycolicibacterium brumae DSM 44177]